MIIISSGKYSEEIIEQIQSSRVRASKVLGINIFCFKLDRWKHMKDMPIVNDVVNHISNLVESFIEHILKIDEENHKS